MTQRWQPQNAGRSAPTLFSFSCKLDSFYKEGPQEIHQGCIAHSGSMEETKILQLSWEHGRITTLLLDLSEPASQPNCRHMFMGANAFSAFIFV